MRARKLFIGGFTLIELVLVIVLLGIVLVAGSSVIGDSFKVSRTLTANAAQDMDVRIALDRIARELRGVSLLRRETGGNEYDFLIAQPGLVKFNKVDAFGVPTNVKICLAYVKEISPNTESLEFIYLDSSASKINLPGCSNVSDCLTLRRQVRSVLITVVTKKGGASERLTTLAAMRSI